MTTWWAESVDLVSRFTLPEIRLKAETLALILDAVRMYRKLPQMSNDNREKKMGQDLFFPSPIYFTDLSEARAINARIKPLIRARREEDPQGEFRTNEPRAGGWHSRTDMHTRREYDSLTREIFELMHGVYTNLGYDPDYEPVCDAMWANINPPHASNRQHTHPHALLRPATAFTHYLDRG